MKKILFPFAAFLLLFTLCLTGPANAQTPNPRQRPNQSSPMTGQDFWLAFMDNSLGERPTEDPNIAVTPPRLRIHLSAQTQPARVKLRYPTPKVLGPTDPMYDPLDVSYMEEVIDLRAGEYRVIDVSNKQVVFTHTVDGERRQKNAIHVSSSVPISCAIDNDADFSRDVSMAYPTTAWGSKYTVMAYDEQASWLQMLSLRPNFFKSQLLIVAQEDSTRIRIVPTQRTIKNRNQLIYPRWRGGYSASIPRGANHEVTLNAGETYMLQSLDDLTGTTIEVINAQGQPNSCRSIAVFGGNQCASVGDAPTCDHLVEQNLPDISQGTDYILTGTSRDVDLFRIMALEDNTIIRFASPADTVSNNQRLMRGQFIQFQAATTAQNRAFWVTGVDANDETRKKPLSIAYFIASDNVDGGDNNADPSMMVVAPIQAMNTTKTTIAVPASKPRILGGITQENYFNYAHVIVPTANEGQLLFNGQPLINRNVKNAIGEGVKVIRVANPDSSQRMTVFSVPFTTEEVGNTFTLEVASPSGLVVYSYGLSLDDSYSYLSSADFVVNRPTVMADSITNDICTKLGSGEILITANGGYSEWRPDPMNNNKPILYSDPQTGQMDTVWFYKEAQWYSLDTVQNTRTALPINTQWRAEFPYRAFGLTRGHYEFEISDVNGCTAVAKAFVGGGIEPAIIDGLGDYVFETSIDPDMIPLRGIPAGGTFSGKGVRDNAFYPKEAGFGPHDITYTPPATDTCYSATTAKVTVWFIVGRTEHLPWHNMAISPNPTAGMIQLDMHAISSGPTQVRIFDIAGRVVAEYPVALTSGQNHHTLDCSHLLSGYYTLTVASNGVEQTFKLVIQ